MTDHTLQLIAQLALSATWDHLDDDGVHPVDAAREVLDVPADPARDAMLRQVVEARTDLDFTDRVGLALHLLLAREDAQLPAAA